MEKGNEKLRRLDSVLESVVTRWFERVRTQFVTEEESRELGVEPEIKCFLQEGNYRLKFSRKDELDVTYGLGVEERDGCFVIVVSVNNKSQGFDFDRFVDRLKGHYWKSRNEKPWTDPSIDHFSYGNLLHFEPRMGKSVSLDLRKEKADIIRLSFGIKPQHEELLLENGELLRDLVENFCLNPLKRIYAESYREG